MDVRRVQKITSITAQITGMVVMIVLLGIFTFFESLRPHAAIWQQPLFYLSLSLILGVSLGWLIARRVLGALQFTVFGLFIYVLFFRNFGLDWSTWTPRSADNETRYEIAGPTLDDRMFDIKASSAKLLLVDFWATWCIPCRAQLKHIKSAYQHYHAQGLDVVGVSCDQNKDALSNYVQDNAMTWPQIIFDEQTEEPQTAENSWSPLAKKYGISAIPTVLLLDPKSERVIATAASGAQLDSVIAGILKKLDEKNLTADLVENNILVFIPVAPYGAALLAALVGALIDRRKSRKPVLKLVQPQRPKSGAGER
jgi:thiol-disulfide isomerase/thioredoxin